LIHAVDWNRLEVLNLDTLQNLTAAKSLIEEDAEKRHLEFVARHTGANADNRPWPHPFDYFYGALLLSPDKSYFFK